MSTLEHPPAPLSRRPKRADARRNYDKLVAAARQAFTEADRSTALEDVARRAGVGIGTLYRHFPTRRDLIEAVYVEEVESLARAAADRAPGDPWDDLKTWLHGFLGYVATKQALAEELFALPEGESDVFARCRLELYAAGEPLLERAKDAGAVRPDVTIEEVVRMVSGIAKIPVATAEEIERILDVALDGLRYRPGA